MPDQQVNLSDAELQEAVKAGWFQENPALLNKLDSDSRRRFVRVNAESHPHEGGIGPAPSEPLPGTNLIGGKTREFLTTPLAHPTGTGMDALTSPLSLGIGGGMAIAGGLGAAASAGVGGRVLAGARGAAAGAAPQIKYEVAKHAMMAAHIPETLAGPLAMVLSGMGTKAPEAAPPETPAAPAGASVPTAPEVAPSPAPVPASAAPTRAPRARTGRGSVSASQTSEGFSLSPEETTQAERWMAKGVPPEEILNRILMSRKLTKATGAPTPQEMRNAVDQRNATGRWPDEP